jgi:hypothetical protein
MHDNVGNTLTTDCHSYVMLPAAAALPALLKGAPVEGSPLASACGALNIRWLLETMPPDVQDVLLLLKGA